MPWVLIALGLLIILGIIVLLMRMRKGEEREPEVSPPDTEESPSAAAVESDSIEPLPEEPKPEAVEAPTPSTSVMQEVSGTAVSELPVIKEPIEELPGIDREDFSKFSTREVLVVEDNKINQKLILTLLNASGISLATAEDGVEALEKLRAPGAHYDLVLMDVNMPNMDGLQATREIRKDKRLRDIPVVALTASTSGDEVEAILESGMNAYLDKPIVLGKLYRAFEIFMEEYRRRKENIGNEEKAAGVHIDSETLDVEKGLRYSNNDRGLYAMLLEDFLATYADSDKKLSQWIKEKDYDSIRSMIVDLEGITGTLGAGRLYSLTKKIRQVLDRRTYSILSDFLDEYREELQRLKEEVGKYLAAP